MVDKQLGAVIEDGVDAGDLLQYGDGDSKQEGAAKAAQPAGSGSFLGDGGANLLKLFCSGTASPPMAQKAASASSTRFCWKSQRGLSGTKRRQMIKASAGIAAEPNIQRHAAAPVTASAQLVQ